MAEIYQVLQLADDAGKPTGKYRYTRGSDEGGPTFGLCEHEHESKEEAEDCPQAKDTLDRAFFRGAYAPPIAEIPVSVLDGLIDTINARLDEIADQEARGRAYSSFELRTAYYEIRDIMRGYVSKADPQRPSCPAPVSIEEEVKLKVAGKWPAGWKSRADEGDDA